MDKSKMVEIALTLFGTLIAAFGGAWFAYYLSAKREEKKRLRDQAAAGNRALFAVLRQFHALNQLKTQTIDPIRKSLRKKPLGSFNMRPVGNLQYHDNIHIDISEITFLLETKFHLLPGEASVMDARFHQSIQVLRDRAEFIEGLHPIVSSEEFEKVDSFERIRRAIGEFKIIQLDSLTFDAIKHVDTTVQSLAEFYESLFDGLSILFPKHGFIRPPGDGEEAIKNARIRKARPT